MVVSNLAVVNLRRCMIGGAVKRKASDGLIVHGNARVSALSCDFQVCMEMLVSQLCCNFKICMETIVSPLCLAAADYYLHNTNNEF